MLKKVKLDSSLNHIKKKSVSSRMEDVTVKGKII